MVTVEFRGVKELRRYFGELAKTQIELNKLTQREAEAGKRYARDIAPFDTGALISAIDARAGKESEYTIVSRTPKGKSNPRNVPYHVYLHEGANVNIKKGRRQRYMNETYDYLRKRYPDRVEKELDKQLKK